MIELSLLFRFLELKHKRRNLLFTTVAEQTSRVTIVLVLHPLGGMNIQGSFTQNLPICLTDTETC